MKIDFDVHGTWERDGDGDISLNDIKVGNLSIMKELDNDEILFIKKMIDETETAQSGTFETEVLDVEVDVDFTLHQGSEDRFSHSHGNWLPGDAPSVEIKSVKLGGINIWPELSGQVRDRIEREVYSANESVKDESAAKRYTNAIDRVEKKLYSRMRRGKIKSTLGKKGKSKIPGFSYWFNRK